MRDADAGYEANESTEFPGGAVARMYAQSPFGQSSSHVSALLDSRSM